MTKSGITSSDLRQMATYALVGGVNTLATAAVMWLSDRIGVAYQIYTVYAYVVGILISFTLNRLITFRSTPPSNAKTALLKFVILNLVLLGLVQLVQYLLIEILKTPKVVGVGTGMVLYTGLGYLANRFWVFRAERKPHEAD